jgi:hypothetical protein
MMIPPPPEIQAAMRQMVVFIPTATLLALLAAATGALCLIWRIHRLPVAADPILSAARAFEKPKRQPRPEAPVVWVPHQLRDDSYRDDTGREA